MPQNKTLGFCGVCLGNIPVTFLHWGGELVFVIGAKYKVLYEEWINLG